MMAGDDKCENEISKCKIPSENVGLSKRWRYKKHTTNINMLNISIKLRKAPSKHLIGALYIYTPTVS